MTPKCQRHGAGLCSPLRLAENCMQRICLAAALLVLTGPAMAADPLILISIDGFRADYLARGQTPNLAALAKEGVRASAMHPAFPSLTFPNHYTLVTGLYPDHHGVVGNVMWDAKVSPDKFTMNAANSEDPGWWEGATPLWVGAQEQGRVVASACWPGSGGGLPPAPGQLSLRPLASGARAGRNRGGGAGLVRSSARAASVLGVSLFRRCRSCRP